MGVALVPDYSAERQLAAGELILPVPEVSIAGRDYWLAVPEGAHGPTLQRFKEWLLRAAGSS
jgi:DNA-binding transcriptional LysR family regulator